MIVNRLIKGALVAACLSVCITGVSAQDLKPGDEVVIVLSTGAEVRGTLKARNANNVEIFLNDNGLPARYDVALVQEIKRQPKLDEYYATLSKDLKEDDYAAWVQVMNKLAEIRGQERRLETKLAYLKQAQLVYTEKLDSAPGGEPAKISAIILNNQLTQDIAELQKAIDARNITETFQQRYAKIKEQYKGSTVEDQLALAKWNFEQPDAISNRYALQHIENVLTLEATNAEALELKKKIEDAGSSQSTTNTNPDENNGGTQVTVATGKGMSQEQINLIRVYEIVSPSKTKPRARVTRELIDTILDKYRDEPAMADLIKDGDRKARQQIAKMESYEVLNLLFDLKARDLYGKFLMLEDPPVLITFRQQLHRRYVVGYFAKYFSGAPLGASLYTDRPNSLNEVYANFFLLSTMKVDGNEIINRSNADDSLLLQWGLPRENARFPAPEIEGWRPYFTGKDDKRYIMTKQWIESLLLPAPDYHGLNYVAPRP